MRVQSYHSLGIKAVTILALAAGALLLGASSAFAQDDNPFGDCKIDFFVRSILPMAKNPVTGESTLSGEVIAICDGTELYADEVRWNDKTISARGNLLIVQEGLRVTADRMEMDRATRLGTFWNAYGTARLTDEEPDKNLFGTLEPEVMFRADRIERIGRRQYRMTNGWFTTCVQPEPRWVMTGSSGTITLDDSVSLRNVVFRVKKVPVLYVPYLYYPLGKDDRKTGFLIPTYSNSNVRGPGVSAAFFWAINRSQDATIYWDGHWQSSQGLGVEYRYQASHTDSGYLRVNNLWEQETVLQDGTPRPAKQSWHAMGRINQALGRRFQLIGDIDYFSDTVSQQLYQQGAYEFTQSSRRVNFAVVGGVTLGKVPLRLEAKYFQQDVLTGLESGSRLGRTPEFRISVDGRTINQSISFPVTVGGSAEFVHLDAKPDFTNPAANQEHWRGDGRVYLSAPFKGVKFVNIRPSAAWRFTTWTETLDPVTRTPIPVSLSRSLFDFSVDVIGPSLERVWRTPNNKFAGGFKHVIQPRVTTQWMTAFDSLAQVIQIDPSIDGLVGGTVNVNYSLTNSILASRRREDGGTNAREIVSVGIGQTYHSNALAALSDTQYLTPAIANFRPVWVRALVSPTERVNGNFEMYIHPVARAVQSYSAGATINAEIVTLIAGWTKVESIASVPELSNPDTVESHYARAAAHVKLLRGKIGVNYAFDWDLRNDVLLQQRVIANYIAQCCGFAVDYQVRGLAHLVGSGAPPVDRRWSFSVTLAGIGTFSNPFGSFRQ